MNLFSDYLNSFIKLFFPKNCEACNANLVKGEDVLCTKCLYEIPKTKFHKEIDNTLNKTFYSISNIKYATAYYFFRKGSKFQSLIHKLKYEGNKNIGVELGKLGGSEIKNSMFSEIDLIIPVPLHPIRKRERGYNQSEMIAMGLSQTMEKDYRVDVLLRHIYTQTQTKKTLEERRNNVKFAFKINNSDKIKGKHILLVDDVVTTGSTLVACANELLKIDGVSVSIFAVAYVDN